MYVCCLVPSIPPLQRFLLLTPILPSSLYLQFVSFKSVFTRLYQAVMSVVLLFLVGVAPARSSTPSNDHVPDAPKIMLTHADDSFSGTWARKLEC